jgi:hypothetical protein
MKLGKTILSKAISSLFLFLLLINQDAKADGVNLRVIPKDSLSEIQLRSISQNSLDSLLQLKAFQYHSNEGSTFSLLGWLSNFISKIIGRQIRSIEIPGWLWYLVMIALTIFIIYKIIRSNFKPVFYNPVANGKQEQEGIPENIHSLALDELIALALSAADFRTALRFQYLKLLKLLFDKGIVEYRKEKSNHDYQKDLAELSISRPFSRLTVIYEWVWYGKFILSYQDYSILSPEFEKAYIEINE